MRRGMSVQRAMIVAAWCATVPWAAVAAQTRPTTGPSTGPASGPAAVAAAAPVAAADSRVVAVTVYRTTALVTREVDARGAAGLVEVVVANLPPRTVASSLYTEGAAGVRVLSTRYRTRAVQADARDEVRAKEEQLRQLRQKTDEITKSTEVQTQDAQLLSKLETFTNATMNGLMDKGMLNPEATVKLAQFIMDQRAQKAKAQVELQAQMRATREAIAFGERQLAELTSGVSRQEQDAVITVDKADAAPGKVRLNYLVDDATWRPIYKLRGGGTGKDQDPVVLEYLAEIVQQSGEDWAGADVVLSTAEPMLNAAPPELLALDVTVSGGGGRLAQNPATRPAGYRDNFFNSQQLRKQAQVEMNSNNGTVAWQINNDAAALEQTNELLQADQAGGDLQPREGPSVTYHLKHRLTVPSRNDPQLIEVARIDLPPTYFYKTVPVLAPHVYRLATVTNKSELVLLPGEATMYVGTDFVGRMNLPLVAVGEQFTVGFGVDPQVQVTRELVNKSRGVQGGNQVQTYDYRLRLQNFKPVDVQVQVWDRLPRAEAEAVGVVLVKSTPELSGDAAYVRADRPKNLLRWDLTLKANSTGEKAATAVDYQFKLEYARDVAIGNFKATK
jgi:uncharacterized protein (TIGR02231 family)